MNPVTGLIKGAIKPVTDILESKEETKRKLSGDLAEAQVASAAWRPWLARLTGWCLLVYVAGTLFMTIWGFFAIRAGYDWADATGPSSPLNFLWMNWRYLGDKIFDFAVIFLTTYAGARGFEKVAESVGGKVQGLFTREAPEAVVERKIAPAVDLSAPIQRMPGVVVPKVKPVVQTGPVIQGIQLGLAPLRRNTGNEFSARSISNVKELAVMMQRVAARHLAYSLYDIAIIEAGRTVGEQEIMVANGLSKTMDSRHTETPAQAYDFLVYDENGTALSGKEEWHLRYYVISAEAARQAAADEGIDITSGALDWGWDYYHIERARTQLAFKAPDIVLA